MTGEAVVSDEQPTEDPLRPHPALLARIEAARNGDAAAFEEIMVLTERRVAQIAWRILGDAEDVKDAMQETFLRFFRHLRRYDETQDLMGWLSRITVNASLDLLRRRRRLGIFDALESAGPIADRAPAADDDLIHRSELALLRRAIDALPPKQRVAMLLRDVEGLSTTEVAAALSSSPVTVRVQLSRARLKVRRLLQAWNGETTA